MELERNKEIALHNDKYNFDYNAIISGYGLALKYKYKGRICTSWRGHMLGMNEKEILDDEINRIIEFFEINEREKKNKDSIRNDVIDSNKYLLFVFSTEEDSYYKDFQYSNKKFDETFEAYKHSGITTTYFIIRAYEKGKDGDEREMIDFAYNPLVGNVDFESFCYGNNDIFFENRGKNCLFVNLGKDKYLLRPGERIKMKEENKYKQEIHLPEGDGRIVDDNS